MKKLILALPVLFILLVGCNTSDNADNPEKPKDPVTLDVLIQVGLNEEEFTNFFIEPLKETAPHITVNQIRGQTIPDMVLAGAPPDLVYTGPGLRHPLEMEYAKDLSDPFKKYNIAFDQLNPNVQASVKSYGNNGEVYSLPFMMNAYALWYNIDIFDQFGVDYPTDGMTWDELIALGRETVRIMDGIQYKFDIVNGVITNFGSPLALEVVDLATNKAIVSDQWRAVFQKAMNAYQIPGNMKDLNRPRLDNMGPFTQDKTLSMATFWSNGMITNLPKTDINWDVVQLPSFDEAPNIYLQSDYHQFFVFSTTDKVDAAMELLKVAVSEETQMKASRLGKITVLENKEIQDQYGADLDYLNGKNLAGIFKSGPAKRVTDTKYNGIVNEHINTAFISVMNGEMDINSALRVAEEGANQRIAQEIAAQ